MSRKFQFDKLVEPIPGCTYGKYWSWQVRKYGRWLFKFAVQEHWSELPDDPWSNEDQA